VRQVDIELNLTTETVDHASPVQPVCVCGETTVREAFQRMRDQGAGSLLICRDTALVGIFTERDALRLMARGGDLDVAIEKVMIRSPATVSAQTTVAAAIRKMTSGGYRRLPIVDREGRPKGMVTVSGIVHYLVQHFPKTIYNQPPVAYPVTQQREGS
jgi:CBS domain-containing protein